MDFFLTLASADFENSIWAKIVTGLVVYFVARKEVRAQFSNVTSELSQIKEALKQFGQKLTDLETAHDARLTKVENDVSDIKKDILNLKIKPNP